jgi:L,D-transpeptidase YcbB
LRTLFLHIFLISFISFSCGTVTHEDESNRSEIESINSLNNQVKSISSFSSIEADSLFDTHLLKQLTDGYALRDLQFIWIHQQELTEYGQQALLMFENARSYGLNPYWYTLDLLDEKIKNKSFDESDELTISRNFLLFSKHYLTGLLDSDLQKLSYNPISPIHDTIPYSKLLISNPIQNLLDMSHQLTPSPDYHNLLKALDFYCSNHTISSEKVKVPLAKIDSAKSYDQARKALLLHGYIDESSNNSQLMDALKLFQVHSGLEPDGKIGKYTALALERSTYDCWLQAALTLQKWRWEKDWPVNVLYVNIPSYLLKIFENNQFVQEHRVVVGTSWTPSPTLNSVLNYFILNPEWYVPSSITQGELIPKMQKDPTYLKRNNYTLVSKDGKTLDDIDWNSANSSNFKYTIKQGKGTSNALGLVKFIFNNPYSVYLHDTPSKSFFEKDIRSFSHGCIRVQEPFKLVEYILNRENGAFKMEDVTVFLENKSQKTVTPKLVYPIRIRYMCSSTTQDLHLVTHLDIYKKEVLLLAELSQLLPCL